MPLGHRRVRVRCIPRQWGHPQARRRAVRHSAVPRASWLPAPDRRLSRTSQRLRRLSASAARWTRGLPERPAARVGERRLQTRRHLDPECSQGHQAQGAPSPRALNRGRKQWAQWAPPRLGCPAERSDPPGPMEPLLPSHRPHAHGSVHADGERVVEVPLKGRNRELPYQSRRPDLDPRGVDPAAGPVAEGMARRDPC